LTEFAFGVGYNLLVNNFLSIAENAEAVFDDRQRTARRDRSVVQMLRAGPILQPGKGAFSGERRGAAADHSISRGLGCSMCDNASFRYRFFFQTGTIVRL